MADHSLDMLAGVPTKGLRHHVKIAGIGKIIMEGLIAGALLYGGGEQALNALQAGAIVFWRKYAAMTELDHVLDVSLTEHKHRTAGGHVVPLDELEREAILARMPANQGNVSQTARELGKTRDEMRRLMKRHHTLVACAAAVDRHHRPDAASSTTAETLRLRPPTSP